MNAEKITLSGVPETMLQTLYARAKESRTRGAIRDQKAEELVSRLDYDFTLADRDKAMHSGVIARTIVLDRLVGDFLQTHPGAVVVNIACGLDTRCYRMTGYARWYNLDLPETMAVRARLLPENGVITQLACSAMDAWGGQIEEHNAPVLIIIEGLTMYLSQWDVQRIFAVIAGRFPAATVLAETMNPMVVRRFKEKSIEGSQARFTWGVRGGRALAPFCRASALPGNTGSPRGWRPLSPSTVCWTSSPPCGTSPTESWCWSGAEGALPRPGSPGALPSFYFFSKRRENWLTNRGDFDIIIFAVADVAELADAHGSGPCESNFMGVQVPSSAPSAPLLRQGSFFASRGDPSGPFPGILSGFFPAEGAPPPLFLEKGAKEN